MNRSELLFLYDIKDANPNGDPLDENKPRIDEETGTNIVTDVRLKRTIRDYLYNFKKQEIFIREIKDTNGYIQDGKTRAKDFKNNAEEILKKCIDIRLFGGVIPLDKDSITFTGPVQFGFGRSLHKVEIKHIRGTGAFASGTKQKQATFREEDILYYSLICFKGIINENAAKHTQLTEEDIKLLLEAIWNGTKNLISRSKFGQIPRLLLKIDYTEENYHLGDLDKNIKLLTDKNDTEIRDVSDYKIDITDLIKLIDENKDKIAQIEYAIDKRLIIISNNENFNFETNTGIKFINLNL